MSQRPIFPPQLLDRCICGAAGTYSLLRPRDSRRILDAKLAEVLN